MTNAYPDVRKSVIVNVPIAKAWAIFTDRPIEWWPDSHVLVKSPREVIVFEPIVGGRYYERAQVGHHSRVGPAQPLGHDVAHRRQLADDHR
jgi:hypothetical protein